MKTRHSWAHDTCFCCSLLDMRSLKDGRVVFWCAKQEDSPPNAFLWRRDCKDFVPLSPSGKSRRHRNRN